VIRSKYGEMDAGVKENDVAAAASKVHTSHHAWLTAVNEVQRRRRSARMISEGKPMNDGMRRHSEEAKRIHDELNEKKEEKKKWNIFRLSPTEEIVS